MVALGRAQSCQERLELLWTEAQRLMVGAAQAKTERRLRWASRGLAIAIWLAINFLWSGFYVDRSLVVTVQELKQRRRCALYAMTFSEPGIPPDPVFNEVRAHP